MEEMVRTGVSETRVRHKHTMTSMPTLKALHPKRPYDLDHAEARDPGKLGAVLREWGVAVVKDVFDAAECRAVTEEMVRALEALSSGKFDRTRASDTWNPSVLPPMVRSGLVQALMGNLAAVSDLRADPRCETLFRLLYTELHGEPVEEVVTSVDGVNIRPPVEPLHDDRTEDWPHVDVSRKGRMYECVQGQVVLNPTSAAFRCSPKSHLVYEALLGPECGGHEQDGDWTRLQRSYADKFAAMVTAVGGKYQVPVHAPAGSMIFWLSSTLHSAQVQRRTAAPFVYDPADPLKNWRAVVYVCHVPRRSVDDRHIYGLHYAAAHNRSTNHNGRRLFPLVPPTQKGVVFHPDIAKYIQDPARAYELLPPTTNPAWTRLLGTPTVPAPPGWTPFLPETKGGRGHGHGRGDGRGSGSGRSGGGSGSSGRGDGRGSGSSGSSSHGQGRGSGSSGRGDGRGSGLSGPGRGRGSGSWSSGPGRG